MTNLKIIGSSLAITLLQILLLLCAAPSRSGGPGRYGSLLQWDSVWFKSIVDHGYISDFPPSRQRKFVANVAFFPSFPLAATAVKRMTGISVASALILVSQLSCFLFWFYFFLLCRHWQIPDPWVFGLACGIFSYYGSYFLALPYSEPLFMASMLGMLYFFQRFIEGQKHAWIWVVAHGIVLSGSRLVGVVMCAYPALYGILRFWNGKNTRLKSLLPFLGLTLSASLGCWLFFLYCQLKFGHWNLYFLTQINGWNVKLDFLWPLRPDFYLKLLSGRFHRYGYDSGRAWGQVAAAAFILFTAACVILEARWIRSVGSLKKSGFENRWPLFLCSGLMFYISMTYSEPLEYMGMYRYCLTTAVPMALAGTEVLKRQQTLRGGKGPGLGFVAFFCLICGASLYLQFLFATKFTAGLWME